MKNYSKKTVRKNYHRLSALKNKKTGYTYMGKAGGIKSLDDPSIHPELKKRLSKKQLESWNQANCAKCDATNQALWDGAEWDDLSNPKAFEFENIDGSKWIPKEKCAIVMLHLVVRMKMNNNLKKVSIKGRVAFSIHCFLNAVAKTDFVKSDDHLIDLIVNRAWYFVENDDLIMAYENFLDVVPGCILDHKVAGHVEFDSISYEDYLSLKRLYTIWPKHLNVILDSISYIMSFDLYSNTGEYSSDTLRFTNEIIEVVLDNNLILPGVDRFLISSFNEKGGWGNKIKRNKF